MANNGDESVAENTFDFNDFLGIWGNFKIFETQYYGQLLVKF